MNNLPLTDSRRNVLQPGQPLMVDAATAALYSNGASERFGHHAITTPSAALPVSFELETTTRTDPRAQYLTPGVLEALTVGPLPEAFGIALPYG